MIVLNNGLKKDNKLEYLFHIIVLLYNSNSFFVTVDTTIGLILLVISILFLLWKSKWRIPSFSSKIIVYVFVSSFVSLIVNAAIGSIGTTIRFILIVLYALLLSNYIDFETLEDLSI